MGAKESAETRAGLALLAQGFSVRMAAKVAGVAPSTLTRAQKRREDAPSAHHPPIKAEALKVARKLAKKEKTP